MTARTDTTEQGKRKHEMKNSRTNEMQYPSTSLHDLHLHRHKSL